MGGVMIFIFYQRLKPKATILNIKVYSNTTSVLSLYTITSINQIKLKHIQYYRTGNFSYVLEGRKIYLEKKGGIIIANAILWDSHLRL